MYCPKHQIDVRALLAARVLISIFVLCNENLVLCVDRGEWGIEILTNVCGSQILFRRVQAYLMFVVVAFEFKQKQHKMAVASAIS
jgi:hypothetical protein